NLPPEIVWSNLRCNFMPGFEDVLSISPVMFLCVSKSLSNLIPLFWKWIFIPWLQLEIDAY
ncbi:hypothetical protein K435DRAFT_606102, partial [Dendrothele bispora CBS 962.96]